LRIYYNTPLQDPKLCGVIVVPMSNVRTSAILLTLSLYVKLKSMKLGVVSSDTTRPILRMFFI